MTENGETASLAKVENMLYHICLLVTQTEMYKPVCCLRFVVIMGCPSLAVPPPPSSLNAKLGHRHPDSRSVLKTDTRLIFIILFDAHEESQCIPQNCSFKFSHKCLLSLVKTSKSSCCRKSSCLQLKLECRTFVSPLWQ